MNRLREASTKAKYFSRTSSYSAVPMPGQLVRNKQVKLKQYALAALKETDLEDVSSEFTLELKEDSEDDVLVRNLYLSCDPYMRILMSGLEICHSPFRMGQVSKLSYSPTMVTTPEWVSSHHGQHHWWQYLFSNNILPFTIIPLQKKKKISFCGLDVYTLEGLGG